MEISLDERIKLLNVYDQICNTALRAGDWSLYNSISVKIRELIGLPAATITTVPS